METDQVKKIVEALLFATDQPLPVPVIKNILGELQEGQDLEKIIADIAGEYAGRGAPVELRFIAEGWQFSTKKEFSPWIRRLYREKTTFRLSVSALETLSIVAYKQPITRSEIEEIRGVEVTTVMETLLERKLVHIVGRKETIGRPLLYGTTMEFLRHFGLEHLSGLPSLEELAPSAETTEEPAPEENTEQETPAETGADETPEQQQ